MSTVIFKHGKLRELDDVQTAYEKRKKRTRVFNPISSGQTRGLPDLISAAKNEPKEFAAKLEKIVTERKLRFEDINLRDVYHGFKDVQVPVFHTDPDGRQRSIQASAFPLLAGLLMVAELENSYQEVASVGDELVVDFEDSKKVTVIARLLTLDTKIDQVDEAKDFPEIGASEESYEVLSVRNGRKLSITQEMIDENDIPNIVERVNKLAEIATTAVEKITLSRVCDQYGSAGSPAEPYALRPRAGGPIPLYVAVGSIGNFPQAGKRAPSGTLKTGNAFTSGTNLDNLRIILADMRNDRGEHIAEKWSNIVLLVPNALLGVALKTLMSELEPGVLNEYNNWGPRGPFRPTLISTPKLDDISSSDYFLGNFKREFRRKWKTNFEYVTLGADSQRYLDARIAFQARIAWDMGVNAVDYNGVVKSST